MADRGPEPGDARRRTFYLTGVGVVMLYLAYLSRAAVVPLLLALLAAYILAPLVAALQRRRFSRVGAVTTLFVAFFGSSGLAIAFGMPPLVHEARSLVRAALGEPARTLGMRLPGELQILVDRSGPDSPLTLEALTRERSRFPLDALGKGEVEDRGNFERKLREVLESRGEEEAAKFKARHDSWLVTRHEGRVVIYDDRNLNGKFDPGYIFDGTILASRWVGERFRNPEAAALVEDLGIDVFPDLSETFLAHTGDFARGALGILGTLFGLLSWGLIIPLYTFFFLMRLEDVWTAFVGYLPGSHRDRVVRVLHRIHLMLIGFFRGRLLTMVLKGFLVAFGLAVVGTPYWVVFGALAGVLTIIPAVGPLAAGAPAVLLAYSEGGGLPAGLTLGVLVAAELVEGYILIPKMVGKEVGLHPMAVITGILIGGALLGVLGVVIAIPLAAAAKIVWDEFVEPAIRAKAAEPPVEPGNAVP